MIWPMQLLLVDDEPRMARALEFALRGSDIELRSLSDPGKLESSLQESRPDVILLDIGLAGVDGLEICRGLKQHAQFGDIPILLLSGLTNAETKAAGLAAGADDFISKPIDAHILLRKVAKWKKAGRSQHVSV